MGLHEWIRKKAWDWLAAAGQNSITTSEELASLIRFGGRDTSSGIQVNVKNASGLAAVAVCERVLTSDLSQLPLILYRKNGERKEQAKEGPKQNLYKVLHQAPNRYQSSLQFRKMLMRDWFYRGNAYALITWGRGGDILELNRLHPDAVEPKQDERTGTITYEYSRFDGQKVTYPKKDIFHYWDTSDDGVKGVNPIQHYRESIADGIALRQHGSSMFKHGTRVSGVMQLPPGVSMGPEAVKAFLNDWNEMYAGNENAHKTAVLQKGMEFKPVSLNMQDAQWIESRKKTDRDIYGIYGVPPHKGGDLDQAAVRANVEAENISYVVGSLMPRLVCIEQCIMRDLLLNDDTYEVRHNISGLLRGDAAGRAGFYKTMVSIKAMTPNEVREKEEMNPLEGGDEFPEVKADPPPREKDPANA